MLGKVFPAVLGGLVPIERGAGLGVLHHGGHQIGHCLLYTSNVLVRGQGLAEHVGLKAGIGVQRALAISALLPLVAVA